MVRGRRRARRVSALAGNRSVVMDPPANVIRAVLSGGFQPATAGTEAVGMPPFGHVLDDADTAAVVTFIRTQWATARRRCR